MKHYYPAYYEAFRCIAADCPDSCCQGWDVVVDEDAETYYRTAAGEMGERIRAAVYTDSDGDRVFCLTDDKKCPFWGEDKLCDIYKELGEEHLCATCAQFPRLSMEYSDFCEHSMALACPEAARLILLTDNAYRSFTQESSAACEDYDTGAMELLLRSRAELDAMICGQTPLSERLGACLQYARRVQSRLSPVYPASAWLPCPEQTVGLFRELEYIDEQNRRRILSGCRAADFSGQEAELTRLALYDLYRYYLTAIDSSDVLTPIRYMILSITMISNIAREYALSVAQAAQLYSKEVEQSYENMERIADYLNS